MSSNKYHSFTMLELLIIIALIGIIAAVVLIFLNPLRQINKSKDGQRIHDLNVLQTAFEDYYNDHDCYPTPINVCYPGSDNGDPVNTNPCYICGSQPGSPTFSPYLSRLPCDPDFPERKYKYQVDNISCPSWFKIYADFNTNDNPESASSGCDNGGCGVAPEYGYDYGISNPGVNLNMSPFYYCYNKAKRCNNCGGSTTCHDNPNCTIIYGTFDICCSDNVPKPKGCP